MVYENDFVSYCPKSIHFKYLHFRDYDFSDSNHKTRGDPSSRMITIKDIARLANVSQSTVSKALNDRPDIGAETKKRIQDIALKHSFTPSAFGKGLKSRITRNIGLIFCREPQPLSINPFYSRVLEGIEAETAVNGYSLILHIIAEAGQNELPRMIREQQVDAVILAGIFQRSFVDLIRKNGLPMILLDPKNTAEDCHQILIDNEQGAFLITQYLLQKGHRRIGFVSGDLERQSFKLRYLGYLKAMNQHGIDPEPGLVRSGGLENGYDHVRSLLAADRPTAVFFANDINAIYGLKAILEAGLKIPDDISIVGFDDIELARHASPPLTTVRVYKEELGSLAVRNLLRLIRKETKMPHVTVVPVRIIERESVRDLNAGDGGNRAL
jgi:LacI family transcriptional regulator